jgi:hypothetical protein
MNLMFDRLSKTDKLFIWLFFGYQIAGGVAGIYFLTKIVLTSSYKDSINNLSIYLGYIFFLTCICTHILIKRNAKIWLSLSFFILLLQSIYIHNSYFNFHFVNGVSWVRIFKYSDNSVKSDLFSFSHLIIGYCQQGFPIGWGLNFIALFLMLYFIYLLFKYFIELKDHVNESQ